MKLDESLFEDSKRKKKYNVKSGNMNVEKNIEFFNHVNGTDKPVGADAIQSVAGDTFGGDFCGAADGGSMCCGESFRDYNRCGIKHESARERIAKKAVKCAKNHRELNCCNEATDEYGVERYGTDGKWWYFTTHGVQPGSIPKGVVVLDVKDGQNEKGTHGTFVAFDRVLNTSELDRYELVELAPTNESFKKCAKNHRELNCCKRIQESSAKVSSWGEEVDVWLSYKHVGRKNKEMSIQLWCDEGPFATLTVSIDTVPKNENCAFVDVNNLPTAEQFIREYKLGVPTGRKARSGFVVYPEYEFNTSELDKYTTPDRNESCKRKPHAKKGVRKMVESTVNGKFSAWVANLGKYNEGELVGEWVEFPIDEDDFNDVLERIGIGSVDDFGNPYEEWACFDYEDPFDSFYDENGEYPSFGDLNEYGELVDKYVDDGETIENIIDATSCTFKEAIDGFEDGTYTYVDGITTEEELGQYVIEQYYGKDIPKDMCEQYLDFEMLGRDLRLDEPYETTDERGHDIEVSAGEYLCGDEYATDTEIGESYVDEVGIDGVANVDYYFDYESFGRDIIINGEAELTKDGAVFIG